MYYIMYNPLLHVWNNGPDPICVVILSDLRLTQWLYHFLVIKLTLLIFDFKGLYEKWPSKFGS